MRIEEWLIEQMEVANRLREKIILANDVRQQNQL
jgi:hypothetical protein